MNEVLSGESPTERLKRYGILAYGAMGNMFDVAMVVVGTLFVGLGVSVLLAGFDVVGALDDMSTPAMLGSSIILIVVGMFALGVASEGPLGRGRRLVGFNIWEVGIGRAISAFCVGLVLLLIHQLTAGIVEDLPAVFLRAAEGLRAVAVAGMVAVPLAGVPLSLLIRNLDDGYDWLKRYEVHSVFVVWLIITLILL